MTQIHLEPLLRPVDDDAPTGPNLEYDPAFSELERIATPISERAIGDSLKAAVEPAWDRVAIAATALFERTKDLRAAIHLTAAVTHLEGIAGWSAGLALVHGLLDRYWDAVHPQLDPNDDNDATARANALMPLGDPQSVLGYFRHATFVQSPRLGRYSLRDLRVATGAANAPPSAEGTPPATLVDLEACCMDCPDEQLPRVATALADALTQAGAIDAILRDKLGAAAPDLHTLFSDIEELKKFVDAQCERRFPGQNPTQVTGDAPAQSEALATPDAQHLPGRIQGADDVVRCLDEICDYYERREPSSPLPILLRRARNLVGRSFSDVLRNIAPGGLGELQLLVGPEEDAQQ